MRLRALQLGYNGTPGNARPLLSDGVGPEPSRLVLASFVGVPRPRAFARGRPFGPSPLEDQRPLYASSAVSVKFTHCGVVILARVGHG